MAVVLAVGTPCAAQAPPASAAAPLPAASTQTRGDSVPAPLPFEVVVKAGRMTVKAQRAPVDLLLAEISRQGGVTIHGTGPLQGESVSIHLEDIPLEQGLRHVVANLDAFFFFGSTAEQSAALRALWVYPKGHGRKVAPVPADEWASTLELEQTLSDLDPEVRAEAVERLVERKREKALGSVVQMLSDPDDYVRARALDAAATARLEIALDRLQMIATSDPAEEVRRVALRSVAEHPEARLDDVRVILQGAAQGDQSEVVRREAEEMLRNLPESRRRAAEDRRKP